MFCKSRIGWKLLKMEEPYSKSFIFRHMFLVIVGNFIPFFWRIKQIYHGQIAFLQKKSKTYSVSLFTVISIVSPASSRNLYSVTGSEES